MADAEQRPTEGNRGDPNARGGVYALVDLDADEIFFVGKSVDVRRRLDWWRGRHEGDRRVGATVIFQSDDELVLRAVEQKALDTYGSLRPDPGDVPGRGD